jgi:hypothetical protein
MNSNQLNRILKLIQRTGDKFVVADKDTDSVFVVMELLDYEEMQGVYDEDFMGDDEHECDGCEECDELDKDEVDGIGNFSFDDPEDDEVWSIDSEEIPGQEALPFSHTETENIPVDEAMGEDPILSMESDVESEPTEEPKFEQRISVEEVDFLPRQKSVQPPYSSISEVMKKKEILDENNEPVMEKINHMDSAFLAETSEIEEESLDDPMLDEEDQDRFYLEPV